MNFNEINVKEVDLNPFTKVDDWALLTAGTHENFNMMTVTGVMCGKFFLNPMIQVCAHPNRYTYQFLEKSDYFTVSFFDTPHHPALIVCGSTHGNESEKIKESGLHSIPFDNTVIFEEAKTIFICKKVFHTDINKDNFDSQQLFKDYYKDTTTYHRIYMGMVEKVLQHK